MIPGSPLPNEAERLNDLLRDDILDTESEHSFDDIVKIAALLCGAEIAPVSLVDDRLKKQNQFVERGKICVKGIGDMTTYWLLPNPKLSQLFGYSDSNYDRSVAKKNACVLELDLFGFFSLKARRFFKTCLPFNQECDIVLM